VNKFRVGEFLIESDLNSITGGEQPIRGELKVMQVAALPCSLLSLVETLLDKVRMMRITISKLSTA